MELNLGRIGPYLSDRIVLATVENPQKGTFSFRKANTWWDWLLRMISWIYSPEIYTEENRKTVRCFQEFLYNQVGKARIERIGNRYGIDFKEMERVGKPLLSRDIAKIVVGIQDVKTEDIEEAIQLAKKSYSEWPLWLSDGLRKALRSVGSADELNAENLARAYRELKRPSQSFSLPKLGEVRGGQPTELLACFYFDLFLNDRERLCLQQENPTDPYETFAHNFAARIMRREMAVGMLVPAPNHRDSKAPQFYRVAARLITGEGNISYCLVPATKDTDLKPIQFYRGTSVRCSEIDSSSSIITDLEKEIGETAWESAAIYRPLIKAYLPPMEIVSGHSLGSTLAQHDLVDNPSVRKAYLFNGPGLAEEKVQKFNQRMQQQTSQPIELYISDADRDDLSAMGKIHLGYEAPAKKVKIHYRQYRAKMWRSGVHTAVWDKVKAFYGFEGGYKREQLNAFLNHKDNGSFDWIRETIGPCLSKIFRVVRDFFRWIFGSRAADLRGLQIGVYEGAGWFTSGHWTVRHIRPNEVTQAMAEFRPA